MTLPFYFLYNRSCGRVPVLFPVLGDALISSPSQKGSRTPLVDGLPTIPTAANLAAQSISPITGPRREGKKKCAGAVWLVLHLGGSHRPSNCCCCSWYLDNVSIRESMRSFTAKTHFCESTGDVIDTKLSASSGSCHLEALCSKRVASYLYEALSPG